MRATESAHEGPSSLGGSPGERSQRGLANPAPQTLCLFHRALRGKASKESLGNPYRQRFLRLGFCGGAAFAGEPDGAGVASPVGVVCQFAVDGWAVPAGPPPKAARRFSVTLVTTRPGHGTAQFGSSFGIHSRVPLAKTPAPDGAL